MDRWISFFGFSLLGLAAVGGGAPNPISQTLPLTPAAFSPIEAASDVTVDILPVIDMHMHVNADMSAEELVAVMDGAGVRRMVLMARYPCGNGCGTDEQALDYARRYPGRFVPFFAGQRPELRQRGNRAWLNPDRDPGKRLLAEAQQKLASGEFFGLGEFIIRHYAYRTGRGEVGAETSIPLDSPLMRRFADLAARYHVPLLIHAEGEPKIVEEMESLLKYEPGAKTIWAHNCGRSGASQIRRLMAAHANLYCDLGNMTNIGTSGYGTGWPRKTEWTFLIENGNGRLFPDVKQLYEEFPDRFFIGADVAYTPALSSYRIRMTRFRELIGGLKLGVARKIAFENAEAILGLDRRKK